ncbi:DUF3077 domain-containing protein [Pseudomonas chlororaphis]|uniref:DUF3077 domain-containing protein n=1 Tax=Pseudomonas chlororaphis TaxID=587753 RepID=UPI0007B3BFD5|nr:DUF3077 domain-containing protein [Pseudomonas chlororaphis]AZC65491.1 hypothetical protein C4K33_5023 [Pseudomonas chlororaphis subsp. piscium]KZO47195.1 hypothetical protein PCL1391_4710 [Pseudomonas chlororaphis subsp. piscium]MBP5066472.1 DUF3077 domain-containing protein [Pseudomonas chlororaphis]QTT87107.1 DUF3077 domain-containing protein [Pseudomonas chlororaphis]UQS89780.1 DUF3077 domain-containing protein [Pseudomonas chlororaphis subsp. piscium]
MTIKTLGTVTFAPCGEAQHPLFRVNPDVPLREALEHVSQLLFHAKYLAQDAALERDDRYAWAAHYFSEMGKAIVDDLCLGEWPVAGARRP